LPNDLCVKRSDDCKRIVCDDIFKEFEKCGDLCSRDENTEFIEVDDLVCYCFHGQASLCPNINPILPSDQGAYQSKRSVSTL
jgi:hypothetical protein